MSSPAIAWIDGAVLAVHLFSAVLFIGGSFFMWLVIDPVSRRLGFDEAARTRLVGRIAGGFGRLSTALLVILIATGLYNASWYLPSWTDPWATLPGRLLVVKAVLVAVLVALVYVHGLYFGRRISRLAREGQVDALRDLRRKSRAVAYANLGLMLAILGFAVSLQMVA